MLEIQFLFPETAATWSFDNNLIARMQSDFAADKTILRTIVNHADQNVGVYGAVTDSGDLHCGDFVYVK